MHSAAPINAMKQSHLRRSQHRYPQSGHPRQGALRRLSGVTGIGICARLTLPSAYLLIAAVLILLASPTAAQIKSHATVCFAGTGKFELDISFCSLAIQSREHEGPSLATLYTHRGRARLELGDLAGATGDFDAALTHNPASALAHHERGRARHKQGDNEAAITAYDTALALNPRYASAYRNRGTARLHLGRLASSLEDFDSALKSVNYDPASRILRGIAHYLNGDSTKAIPDLSAALDQAYPYPEAVLWLYLAGQNTAALARNATAMSDGAWLDELIAHYLDERSAESVLQAAHHPRDEVRRRRLTQAHFYLGALARFEGADLQARRHYKAAIALEVFDAVERAAARIHLQKMRQ